MVPQRRIFMFAVLVALIANVAAQPQLPPPPRGNASNPTGFPGSPDPQFDNVTSQTGFDGANLRIALHQEPPFVFFDNTKTGNARFSGITVDLINRLSVDLNFQFQLNIDSVEPQSSDKALSAVVPQGGNPPSADVAGGALHITRSRIEDVHFSQAFFDTGYVVVVPRPTPKLNLWAFLTPFSSGLWICVILEMAIVAVLFFLMESPSLTLHKDGESDLVDGVGASCLDSLYWSISALTCTLDKAPKTWAGKLVMLAHGWFFLIIIASYTANLASDLTATSLAPSITSWNDITSQGISNRLAVPRFLGHDTFLAFETKHHGYQFDSAHFDTWEQAMEATLRNTNNVAATFHDSAIVQYYLANTLQAFPDPADRCGLMTVGAPFAPVGYGFAFPQNSAAYIAFSQGIVRLKEEGEITKVLLKYGVGSKAEATIAQMCPSSTSSTLDFKDFHGLCIMTGGICALALLVWALNKVALRCHKKRNDIEAGPEEENFSRTRSEADVAGAVQAGLRAALGDAAKNAGQSPALQGYIASMESGIRAALTRLQDVDGSESSKGPVPDRTEQDTKTTGTAWLVHVKPTAKAKGKATVDRGEC